VDNQKVLSEEEMTTEEILEMANANFQDRKKNTLPTFTFMTVEEELIAFARLIEKAAWKQATVAAVSKVSKEFDSCEPWITPEELMAEMDRIAGTLHVRDFGVVASTIKEPIPDGDYYIVRQTTST
jgi:hypothetical protein